MRKPFTQIPVHIIRDEKLDSAAFRVYCIIKSYNPCWAGTRRLSTQSGLSRNTVLRSIKTLRELGLIETKKNGRGQKYIVYESKEPKSTGSMVEPDDAPGSSKIEPHRLNGCTSTGSMVEPQLDSPTKIQSFISSDELASAETVKKYTKQFYDSVGRKKHDE